MAASVRYIVNDVDEAVDFYTEMHPGPGLASLSLGDVRLLINRPGGGGGAGQSMPSGQTPTPGGWLRFQLEVSDIESTVEKLRFCRRTVPQRHHYGEWWQAGPSSKTHQATQ